MWTPVLSPGVQFSVCLILYDGFLTYVDVSFNALLADLCLTDSDRASMSMMTSFFAALAAFSVFLSAFFWDKADLTAFRYFTFALAAVSCIGFELSASQLKYVFTHCACVVLISLDVGLLHLWCCFCFFVLLSHKSNDLIGCLQTALSQFVASCQARTQCR
jgi:hypothetical protein